MDRDTVWRHVRDQRLALAGLLDSLTDEWDRPSLCAGWRVRDVAAHLVLGTEVRISTGVVELLRARGNFNRMIHDSAVRAADRPADEIVKALRDNAGSRKVPPGGSRVHTLTDVLVHGQDISVPLGRDLPMPTDAARAAADLVWRRGFPFNARRRLARLRLAADDVAWSAGEGDEVRGPIAALLLLLTGRDAAALPRLTGAGVAGLGTTPR